MPSPADPNESGKALAAYIRSTLVVDATVPIAEDTPLISSGLLDSYSVVELITYVEACFDVEVASCWYRLEHLDSLERILATVEQIRRQAT